MIEGVKIDSITKVHVDSSNVLTLSVSNDESDPENIIEQFLSDSVQSVNFVDYVEGDGGVIKKDFPKDTIEYVSRFGDLILIDDDADDYFINKDGDIIFVENMVLGRAFFELEEDWVINTVNPQTNEFKGTLLITQTTAAGATFELVFSGFNLTSGISYDVKFTVDSVSGGSVNVDLGGTNGTSRSTVDTFDEEVVCGGTGVIKIEGSLSGSGDYIEISDFIIKEA